MEFGELLKRFLRARLEFQIAIVCAGLSLISGLILSSLAGVSHIYLEDRSLDQHGTSLAAQLANQVIEPLETGDLLDLVGTLQRFAGNASVLEVSAYDIEGNLLGKAGETRRNLEYYQSPIKIGGDFAGRVSVGLDNSHRQLSQIRFVFSLSGLALLFSVIIYFATKSLASQITKRLQRASKRLILTDTPDLGIANAIDELEYQIEELPLSLLRQQIDRLPHGDHVEKMGVVLLKLDGLEWYFEALDAKSLDSYIDRLQQIVFSAADFYMGQPKMVRNFGLAILFHGDDMNLPPESRAISCSQLIRSVLQDINTNAGLSISVKMAADLCNFDNNRDGDINTGIHLQSCIEDLWVTCERSKYELLLSRRIVEQSQTSLELSSELDDIGGFVPAGYFAPPELDLIDRQRWMIVRKLGFLN